MTEQKDPAHQIDEQVEAGVPDFGQVITQFRSNLEQLSDFVTLLDPILQSEAKKALKEQEPFTNAIMRAIAKYGWLPKSGSASTGAKERAQVNGSNGSGSAGGESGSSADERAHAIAVAGIVSRAPEVFDKTVEQKFVLRVRPGHDAEFRRVVSAFDRTEAHRSHLYNSSLVSLASTVEIYFGDLLRAYYRLHPDAAELKDRVLSFEDLVSINDVEEARQSLLDSKIEEILRGSFADWLKHASQKLKLKMTYLDPYRDRLGEFFQRRNLIVHAGGRVNSLYLSKTPAALRGELRLGQRVKVDDEYLRNAIEWIELSFILIGCELWKHVEPNTNTRAGLLIDAALEYLQADRFVIAEGLCRFALADKGAAERFQLVAQVNYWQAVKWQGRFKEIEKEVRKADFSAKTPDFVLAKFALLDQADQFFELAPRLLEDKSWPPGAFQTWPLFREMRKDPRYADLTPTPLAVADPTEADDGEPVLELVPVGNFEPQGVKG